jgi:hypothetical protein
VHFGRSLGRRGPSSQDWWFGDQGATACWPGISNRRLKSDGRPLQEVLAQRT